MAVYAVSKSGLEIGACRGTQSQVFDSEQLCLAAGYIDRSHMLPAGFD
jgi:hypothetical protein